MSYSKRTVLFVDTVCPKPYSPSTLKSEGMGGTEATVLRVAEALGKHHPVTVIQAGRASSDLSGNAIYSPTKVTYLNHSLHAIVVLRDPNVALNMRKFHKDTPIWLWMHDLVRHDFLRYVQALGDARIGIIVVSRYHRTQMLDILKTDGSITRFPKIIVQYNPIDEDLKPDATPVDKNKLVFFSSPHKGLDWTLTAFKAARRINPEFKLYVSNPGYYKGQEDLEKEEGVVNCGVLSHADAVKHVRSALCVFYPNFVFPETFGLVFAESNAVGTPVLSHPIGAANEVLTGMYQTCDTRNIKVLIDKLMSWHDGGRPIVTGKDEFRISNVIKGWKDTLKV